jgi:large subunit ribosomal protein L5
MSEKEKGEEKEGKAKAEKPQIDEAAREAKQRERAEKAAKGKGAKEAKGDKKGEAKPAVKRTGPPRLLTFYRQNVVPSLVKEFGYKNPMRVPKVVKITVNMGLGEALQNPKILDACVEDLRAITGQAPVVTKAKKSIATFKLRQGQKIGCMVTLRKERMWEFLDRLVNLALPRVRDFKGVSGKAFDGRGNYSMGIKEQIIFPEINYDKVERIKGMNVSIVTTARSDDEGRALLRFLGMPFRQ